MALGYNIEETDRSFEQAGLTGTVKRYALENMVYPCLIFDKISQYQLKIVKQMASMQSSYNEDEDIICLYVALQGKLVTIGKVFSSQVKSVLMLFDDANAVGYYNKDTELTGDYLYVLCN